MKRQSIMKGALLGAVLCAGPSLAQPMPLAELGAGMYRIEAEVAQDRERPVVAGLIENRTRIGMLLQIDATVLYALQEWKELGPGVVKTVESPYNTYIHAGLPPGPIGSPGFKSIEAALKPKANPYLYYVALPDRTHMFSADYAGHLANIRKRKAALKAVK